MKPQSSNHNYILTRTYQSEDATRQIVGIQYYDGLGRLIQTVQKGISPSGKDIVSMQEYDLFGRESQAWLPVPSATDGAYVNPLTIKNSAKALYDSDEKPYNLPVYENSPLNRVLKQYGPGQDWQRNNRAVNTEYLTNIEGDNLLNCIYYKVDYYNLSISGNYPTGELYVNKVSDENRNVSYEFKNKRGKTVLIRQVNDNQNYDTYFAYNQFDNLCYVLPPRIQQEGIDRERLHELSFQYTYDYRNNLCNAKKLPGCTWINYKYDRAQQLIFTQDGEQSSRGEWLFTIPDALGRTVLTGICTGVNIDDFDLINNVVIAEYTGNGAYNGYTIKIGGVDIDMPSYSLLSVNYYDKYNFLGADGFPAYAYDPAKESDGYGKRYNEGKGYETKGLLTGTMTTTFGNDNKLYSVMYYDNRNRLIQTHSTNHLGGKESEYFTYNFIGQPLKKLHIHSKGASSVNEVYTYTYDHAGRPIDTMHKINDMPEILLSRMEYDELGRVKAKSIGITKSE